jgi:hypothetical protein
VLLVDEAGAMGTLRLAHALSSFTIGSSQSCLITDGLRGQVSHEPLLMACWISLLT